MPQGTRISDPNRPRMKAVPAWKSWIEDVLSKLNPSEQPIVQLLGKLSSNIPNLGPKEGWNDYTPEQKDKLESLGLNPNRLIGNKFDPSGSLNVAGLGFQEYKIPRLYHGSPKGFKGPVDYSKLDTDDVLGWMFHSAENPDYANEYAIGQAKHGFVDKPVMLGIQPQAKNVLDLVDPNADDIAQALAATNPIERKRMIGLWKRAWSANHGGVPYSVDDFINYNHRPENLNINELPVRAVADRLRLEPEEFKNSPFDAIRYRDVGHKSWAIPEGTPIQTSWGVPITNEPKPLKVIKTDKSYGGTLQVHRHPYDLLSDADKFALDKIYGHGWTNGLAKGYSEADAQNFINHAKQLSYWDEYLDEFHAKQNNLQNFDTHMNDLMNGPVAIQMSPQELKAKQVLGYSDGEWALINSNDKKLMIKKYGKVESTPSSNPTLDELFDKFKDNPKKPENGLAFTDEELYKLWHPDELGPKQKAFIKDDFEIYPELQAPFEIKNKPHPKGFWELLDNNENVIGHAKTEAHAAKLKKQGAAFDYAPFNDDWVNAPGKLKEYPFYSDIKKKGKLSNKSIGLGKPKPTIAIKKEQYPNLNLSEDYIAKILKSLGYK